MSFGVPGVPREHVPDPVPEPREIPPPRTPPPADLLVPEFTRAMASHRRIGTDFPPEQLIREFVRPRRARHDGYGEVRPEVVRPVPPGDTERPRQAAAFGEFDEDDDRFDLPTPIDDPVGEEILSFPEPDAIRDEYSGIGNDLPDGLPEVETGAYGYPELGIDPRLGMSEGEVDPVPEVETGEDGFPELGIDPRLGLSEDETYRMPEPEAVPVEICSVVELPVVRPAARIVEAGPVGEIGPAFEVGEARNDLPRWGEDLPGPVAVDGPLDVFFDKAARTLGWVALEHLVNVFVPGAGSLVRIAYFIAKYQAVAAGLNDGRGANLQVGVAGDGPLSLAFTIRLGAVDDGPVPRFGLLLELNFMDPLDRGRLDAQGPDAVAAVVTPEGRPYSSLWDLFGIEAVRDHATVLGLAASLSPAEVEQLLRTLRRKWVRCCFTVDRAAGSATITVEDGYGIKTVGVPLS